MSKRQQTSIQDFIDAYEKYGAACLVYDVDKYNEPKSKGSKKKGKSSITWVPNKFKSVSGRIVYPKWKFSEVVLGGGAKYHQGGDDDDEEEKIPTNVTVAFCDMEPEEIAGPGFEARQVAISSDQRREVLKMAKKILQNKKKKSHELSKAKKQMKEMFSYRSNYRAIHQQLADDDLDLSEFTKWLDERITEMAEKQNEENETATEKIKEYSDNTKLFVRFAECYHLAFTANARELCTRQEECDFTIAKGNQDPPAICEFKQSTRTIGDGKNKKVEELPKPLYRFKIPLHKGKVGKWNYTENEFVPVVFDSSKSNAKNKFRRVPAKIENEKGKLCPLTYKNVGQFVTFKSVATGFITAKDMATHMFGISASNELTDLVIRSNQTKSKDGGFDEEEMKKLAGKGSDNESSSDENQDLPSDDETDNDKDDDAEAKGSDDEAADPKFEDIPTRKKVPASSEEDEPKPKPNAKVKKSSKKTKTKAKAKAKSDSSEEDEPEKANSSEEENALDGAGYESE